MNSSPSKPTEPVSSAIRSVWDSGGRMRRNTLNSGATTSGLRMNGSSSGTVTTVARTASTSVVAGCAPSSQHASSATPSIAAQLARRIRWYAAKPLTIRKARMGAAMLMVLLR